LNSTDILTGTGIALTAVGVGAAIAVLFARKASRVVTMVLSLVLAGMLFDLAAHAHSVPTSGHTTGFSAPPSSSPSFEPRASATATTSATPAASGIYHEGRLELAFNTCADLDAPASDSQWGELSTSPNAGGGDMCSQYPSFVGVKDATLVTVNSGNDNVCQNATGWFPTGYYKDLKLSVGSFLCVHTNQGRYSLLQVESINSPADSIVFSVKTFKKPGD
jgi:hypothetical protein